MSAELIWATLLISLPLAFYSTGVWAERLARYLKPWHLGCFWTGFFFDIAGTLMMHRLNDGAFDLKEPHTFTGQVALWLMLAHAIWATVVIRKKDEERRKIFHRYSLIVWLIWLIPYFGGMYIGMTA